MKPTLLILAAGMGSRYGGLKQMDPIGPSGETIIDYSIYDAIRSGYGKVVFVIRQSFSDSFMRYFEERIGSRIRLEYVFQELDNVPEGVKISSERVKPWGTGHAVLVAANRIKEPFVVINADDFYGPKSYSALRNYLTLTWEQGISDHHCMVGYRLKHTLSEHGHVSRGICQTDRKSFLKSVRERTHIAREDDQIYYIEGEEKRSLSGDAVVSMNIWGFQPAIFNQLDKYFTEFIKKDGDNTKSEFFIPFVVNELIENDLAEFKVLKTTDRWFGVTYKEDREQAAKRIRELINRGIYPKRLWS